MSTPFLTEIKDNNELIALRDLYLKDWPNNCVGYYCLNNFIKWRILNDGKRIPNLKIYTEKEQSDNEKGSSDGLYVIIDRYQLFIGSLNKTDSEKLTKALDMLDWSKGFKVSSFLKCHRPSVLEIVQRRNLKCDYDSDTVLYYMPRDEALKLKISCPKGYYIKKLCSATDAETINQLWPNKHEGSLFFVKRQIDWNENTGIYVEETNELVAWCLRLQGGFLGALQVKYNYKRLGLGTVATCVISHQIAERGDDVMALVNIDNTPSCGMFHKLGFTIIDHCFWLRTFPTVEHYSWPDGE